MSVNLNEVQVIGDDYENLPSVGLEELCIKTAARNCKHKSERLNTTQITVDAGVYSKAQFLAMVLPVLSLLPPGRGNNLQLQP